MKARLGPCLGVLIPATLGLIRCDRQLPPNSGHPALAGAPLHVPVPWRWHFVGGLLVVEGELDQPTDLVLKGRSFTETCRAPLGPVRWELYRPPRGELAELRTGDGKLLARWHFDVPSGQEGAAQASAPPVPPMPAPARHPAAKVQSQPAPAPRPAAAPVPVAKVQPQPAPAPRPAVVPAPVAKVQPQPAPAPRPAVVPVPVAKVQPQPVPAPRPAVVPVPVAKVRPQPAPAPRPAVVPVPVAKVQPQPAPAPRPAAAPAPVAKVQPQPAPPVPPTAVLEPVPSSPLPVQAGAGTAWPGAGEGSYLLRGPRGERRVCMTFDGGSTAEVAVDVLDVLHDHGIRTTIFLTGDFIRRYPDLVRRIVREGHEVGNHTLTHPHLAPHYKRDPRWTKERMQKELLDADRAFYRLVGRPMDPYWRPPFGEQTAELRQWAEEVGYRTVGWSEGADTLDWTTVKEFNLYRNGSATIERLEKRMKKPDGDGLIVLMHLGSMRPAFDRPAKYLGPFMDRAIKAGWHFVPVGDYLKSMGKPKWEPSRRLALLGVESEAKPQPVGP